MTVAVSPQEREAQVGSKVINRIKNRTLVKVLKSWQGYTLGIIRERDRQEYEYKVRDLQAVRHPGACRCHSMPSAAGHLELVCRMVADLS